MIYKLGAVVQIFLLYLSSVLGGEKLLLTENGQRVT